MPVEEKECTTAFIIITDGTLYSGRFVLKYEVTIFARYHLPHSS